MHYQSKPGLLAAKWVGVFSEGSLTYLYVSVFFLQDMHYRFILISQIIRSPQKFEKKIPNFFEQLELEHQIKLVDFSNVCGLLKMHEL